MSNVLLTTEICMYDIHMSYIFLYIHRVMYVCMISTCMILV